MTSAFKDIFPQITNPFPQGSSKSIKVNPTIAFDPASPPTSPGALAAAQKDPSTVASHHGLTESKLAAVIVVPIVVLAVLSPILVVWFFSYRRGRKPLRDPHQSPQEPKSPVDSQNHSIHPPQNAKRRPRAVQPTQSTLDFIIQSRPPTRKPRNAHQLRTSHIQNHSLGGFNFDFPRGTTMFSALSTQAPSTRHSGTNVWDKSLPHVSHFSTLLQPYIPPRLQSPNLPGSPTDTADAISPLSPSDDL